MKIFTTVLATVVVGLLTTGPAGAAPTVFDFNASGGSFSGSGYGNSYSMTVGALTVTVTAWSFNGTSFAPAQVVRTPAGQGLGVCNSAEGLGTPPPTIDCDDNGVGNVD